MTDPTPPRNPAATPRWMRRLLVASLALNLLVIGGLAGALARDDGPGRGPRPAEMALGPFARSLSGEDRRAILADLRGRSDTRPLSRAARAAAVDEILEALRARPFDAGRAEATLASLSEGLRSVEADARAALVARVAAMTDDERAAFADRVEAESRRGPPRGD